ncbi:hypothetical protein FSP39_001399 [Pinctada imbricata]|uniref:Tetratricopeptide repeat protein 32 n=1 Tax=Pinctada imbricata TaxID=66713 RepID=A0AA88XT21_PINIB|nr:hypothetical protein FSP39_001399 [Pinctada imbricata]
MTDDCSFELALKLEKEGNSAEALEKYTKFINETTSKITKSETEKLALAYNNRGFLKYLQVDFDGAVEDYTASIQINNKAAITYYNRGTVHYRMSRFDKAISDMSRSLTLDPNFEPAKTALFHAEQDKINKENRPW